MLTVKEFWAPWCGPCKAMKPMVEDLAKEYQGRVDFQFINVDEDAESSVKYQVRNIPMFIIEDGDVKLERKVGAMPKAALAALIEQHLNKS